MTEEAEIDEAENPSAYPASIQAGIPKLGVTPRGWARIPLGDLLRRVDRPAKLVNTETYQLVTARRNRGGIVPREVLRGDQIRTKTQFYVETGDFLISNRQISHGACGIVPASLNGSVVSNEYTAFHTTDALDPLFLSALSHSIYFQQTCFHSSIGIHVEKLVFRLADWMRWEFDIPPLAEQRRIVTVLNEWNQAVDLVERLIAAKQRRYRGLLTRQLFGPHQPTGKELSLTAKRVAGSNSWPLRSIGDFAYEVSRYNRNSENLPVLSCTKHSGIVLSDDYFGGRRIYSEDTSGYKIVERGQFSYATNHLEEGSIGLQDIVDQGLVSPMYTVFGIDEGLIDRHFLISVLKTETYRQVFEMNTSSSVDRRGGLRWEDFAALPFALPPLEEQKRLAPAFLALESDLAQAVASLDAFRLQRLGLKQKLLTGEWRLDRRFDDNAIAQNVALAGAVA